MDSFDYGMLLTATGLILAVFCKRWTGATVAFWHDRSFTTSQQRFCERGFLVAGMILILAGFVMLLVHASLD